MTRACLSDNVRMLNALEVVLPSRVDMQRALARNRLDATCALRSKVGNGNSCAEQKCRTGVDDPFLRMSDLRLKKEAARILICGTRHV